MAAIKAAKMLNIPTMDIQHGLQGQTHFAYSGMVKAPSGGYEIVPELFWVWGDNDKKNLLDSNRIISDNDIFVLGNSWVNKWSSGSLTSSGQQDEIEALVDGYEKVILVTLQNKHLFEEQIYEYLQNNSSNNWLWLIRLHRMHRDEDFNRIKKMFSGLDIQGKIEIEKATSLPLYSLFAVSDCHITGYSTCANEALAFGLPSVLLHPSAVEAYESPIRNGVMFYCQKKEQLQGLIEDAFGVSSEKVHEDANNIFALYETSQKELVRLKRRL
jgi:hypothetical protein